MQPEVTLGTVYKTVDPCTSASDRGAVAAAPTLGGNGAKKKTLTPRQTMKETLKQVLDEKAANKKIWEKQGHNDKMNGFKSKEVEAEEKEIEEIEKILKKCVDNADVFVFEFRDRQNHGNDKEKAKSHKTPAKVDLSPDQPDMSAEHVIFFSKPSGFSGSMPKDPDYEVRRRTEGSKPVRAFTPRHLTISKEFVDEFLEKGTQSQDGDFVQRVFDGDTLSVFAKGVFSASAMQNQILGEYEQFGAFGRLQPDGHTTTLARFERNPRADEYGLASGFARDARCPMWSHKKDFGKVYRYPVEAELVREDYDHDRMDERVNRLLTREAQFTVKPIQFPSQVDPLGIPFLTNVCLQRKPPRIPEFCELKDDYINNCKKPGFLLEDDGKTVVRYPGTSEPVGCYGIQKDQRDEYIRFKSLRQSELVDYAVNVLKLPEVPAFSEPSYKKRDLHSAPDSIDFDTEVSANGKTLTLRMKPSWCTIFRGGPCPKEFELEIDVHMVAGEVEIVHHLFGSVPRDLYRIKNGTAYQETVPGNRKFYLDVPSDRRKDFVPISIENWHVDANQMHQFIPQQKDGKYHFFSEDSPDKEKITDTPQSVPKIAICIRIVGDFRIRTSLSCARMGIRIRHAIMHNRHVACSSSAKWSRHGSQSLH